MAAKYWYVANNGSADWSVAGNWYLGPGGTVGPTGLPTTSDTVYLDQASGSGTLTIGSGTTALCNALICTGFTGELTGNTALTINDTATVDTSYYLILSGSMQFTYTGLLTLTGSGSSGSITLAGKTFNCDVTYSKSNTGQNTSLLFYENWVITGTLTHTSAGLYNGGANFFSCGKYIQSGAGYKILASPITITGDGTVLTIQAINDYSNTFTLTNESNLTKTVTSGATVAAGFEPSLIINGAGTGSYSINGNWSYVYINNTGEAEISFSTGSVYSLFFNNSNVRWNNAPAQTLTISIQDIFLSPNMQVIASPLITFLTNSGYNITCNGKAFNNTITVPSGSTISAQDTFRLNGLLNINAGSFYAPGDAYIGNISVTGSVARDLRVDGILYLTGTGTLVTATTTTGLIVSIPTIYIQDTSGTSAAKTLTFNTIFGSSNVYIAGTGAGLITLAAAATLRPNVYVTNAGGSVSFTTGTISSLTFISGTTCTWANLAAQTLTIVNNLTFAVGQPQPTIATPAMTFTGTGGSTLTMSGITLLGGLVTFNSATSGSTIVGAFSSTGGVTINSTQSVTCASDLTCTILTVTSGSLLAGANVYVRSITSSGTLTRNITTTGYLHFTGNGTLATVTATGLTTSISRIYIDDTLNGGAKTLTFNTVFGSPEVYIAGTTAGLIALAPVATFQPDVYVTNMGGSVSFTTGTIKSLTFMPGTTCTWSNATLQTLTIVNNLILADSPQPAPTLTPTMILQAATYVALAGKTLINGAITIGGSNITIDGNFSSGTAVTFTNSTNTYCTGNVTCGALTLNNTANVYFQKNITASTATISGTAKLTIGYVSPEVYFESVTSLSSSLTISSTNSNPLIVYPGTFNCTTISNSGGGKISLLGTSTSGIVLGCTSITLSTNSSLKSEYATINATAAFSTAAGSIDFNNTTATFLTFGISGVTSNYLVNNSKIFITGATTTAFSLAATIASYSSLYTIIEFTNAVTSNATFAGGGFTYHELIFNRGTSTGNNVITGNNTFTNFRDFGTAGHSITFPSGGIQTIGHFDVQGSPGNVISISRAGTSGVSTLSKSPAGLVICDYVAVTNITANQTNTFYSGPNSTLTNAANWIAGGKVRNQSSLGVG